MLFLHISYAHLAQIFRIQYRKDAQMAYQQKMLAAHTGKTDFPKIRTFRKSEHSTNSVFQDLEAAESLYVFRLSVVSYDHWKLVSIHLIIYTFLYTS